jgi:hypothetical protein
MNNPRPAWVNRTAAIVQTSMLFFALGAAALAAHAHAQAGAASQPFGPDNPFYAPSTLPFHAPPFDKIKESDYQPAIDAGMAEQPRKPRRSPTTPRRPPSTTPLSRWRNPAACSNGRWKSSTA